MEENILQNAITGLFSQINPKEMKENKVAEEKKRVKTGISMQTTVNQALNNMNPIQPPAPAGM